MILSRFNSLIIYFWTKVVLGPHVFCVCMMLTLRGPVLSMSGFWLPHIRGRLAENDLFMKHSIVLSQRWLIDQIVQPASVFILQVWSLLRDHAQI